ncbi:DUF6415 family natural product biosynthesis protein [Streptomyces olivaceus]
MSTIRQPVDADAISHLIATALDTTGALPPMAQLEGLDRILRAEVEWHVPHVQRRAELKPASSRERCKLVQVAERAEGALSYSMSTAPLAGPIHVAGLARQVQELRKVAVLGGDPPAETSPPKSNSS